MKSLQHLLFYLCVWFVCFASGVLVFSGVLYAAQPEQFSDQLTDTEYQQLIKELRCPKCTNQSLADSDSVISEDLKAVVRIQLQQGKSIDEVKQFLVMRYGDFILYDPPVQQNTAVLWYAPLVMFGVGVLGLLLLYYRHRTPRHSHNKKHNQSKNQDDTQEGTA